MGAVEGTRESGSAVETASMTGPGSDPRTKPKLAAVLSEFDLDGRQAPPRVDRDDRDAVLEFVAEAHELFEGLYADLPNDLPGDTDDVVVTEAAAEAPDGHTIRRLWDDG